MITRFNRQLGDMLSYVYAVVAVLTFGEVCARYFFNSPTQWTIEIVLMLAAVHYMMAGPQAYALDGHIRITVLYDRLPERVRGILTILERLVVCGATLSIGYWAVFQARKALEITERSGTNLNTPSPTILKVVLVIAMGLFALQALVHLTRGTRRVDTPDDTGSRNGT
jgi:TRAP-type C4-dicarboxylate transport system permease small subunit